MTDRELLPLAARAAGIDAHWGDGWQKEIMFRSVPRANSPLVTYIEWNPLGDDGDALRLAVKLNLSVCVELDQTWICHHGAEAKPLLWVEHGDNPNAATRRAIVLAAAEIGKQMETK